MPRSKREMGDRNNRQAAHAAHAACNLRTRNRTGSIAEQGSAEALLRACRGAGRPLRRRSPRRHDATRRRTQWSRRPHQTSRGA